MLGSGTGSSPDSPAKPPPVVGSSTSPSPSESSLPQTFIPPGGLPLSAKEVARWCISSSIVNNCEVGVNILQEPQDLPDTNTVGEDGSVVIIRNDANVTTTLMGIPNDIFVAGIRQVSEGQVVKFQEQPGLTTEVDGIVDATAFRQAPRTP
jgi:hypothetical protein